MNAKVGYIFWAILPFLFLTSCFKGENYPVEPIISEPLFAASGDSAVLTFSFTDGDGDIGLDDSEVSPPYDTASKYHYNLYVDYYEKDDVNGWQRGKDIAGDSIVFKYRLEPIIIKGKNRGIKGTMDVAMNNYYNPFSDQSDTIRYRIQLIDRALNESNYLETDMITR